MPDIQNYPVTSYLNDLNLNIDEVTLALKSLPIGKASGPDEISNRVLKELADQLATPLCSILINQFKTDMFPKSGN